MLTSMSFPELMIWGMVFIILGIGFIQMFFPPRAKKKKLSRKSQKAARKLLRKRGNRPWGNYSDDKEIEDEIKELERLRRLKRLRRRYQDDR